ncbi:hypothetical protein KSS87_003562 [Heliosperma pusillum]|nr:hypothetical protein KSS87_002087 [Heliosperma pusillum]KAH9604935.1 hypothetical protein KSS87_003562 [Heliosperma pusillum]
MRFIFEYVTCCMMSSPCNNNEPPTSRPPSSKATEDETRSLVTTAKATSGRRRKRTPTRGSSADWQPSLFAIAEDNAVAATPGKNVEKVQRPTVATAKQTSSQRNVKRCVASSSRVGSSSRSYDFSREPIPMVIPTFSAAPFMF